MAMAGKAPPAMLPSVISAESPSSEDTERRVQDFSSLDSPLTNAVIIASAFRVTESVEALVALSSGTVLGCLDNLPVLLVDLASTDGAVDLLGDINLAFVLPREGVGDLDVTLVGEDAIF